LKELGYESLPHPAYSSDLCPSDCQFFKNLENFLQEVFNNQVLTQNAFEEFIGIRTPEF
jgi:hypothetical protein